MIGSGRRRQFSIGSLDVALAVSRRLDLPQCESESEASLEAARPWRIPELLDHPDGHLRHRRLSAAIRSDFCGGTLLDVGDRFCQLAAWLPTFSVAATDKLKAIPERLDASCFIEADFTQAEQVFPDKSFDIVASTDVLEHVAPGDRRLFLENCVRVARQAVYVAFPSGTAALQAEALIRRSASKNVFAESLSEHAAAGLPDLSEIKQVLGGLGVSYEIRTLTTIFEWLTSFVFGPDDGDRELIRDYRTFIKKMATDEVGSGTPYRYLVIVKLQEGALRWRN